MKVGIVAPIAQLVEHFISNEEVFGSIPNGSSFCLNVESVSTSTEYTLPAKGNVKSQFMPVVWAILMG